VRIYLHAGPAWPCIVDTNDRAPFGKTCAHLPVIRKPIAQSIESFGDGLAGPTRQALCAGIDFYAGYDALIRQHISQGRSSRTLLMDRLVLHDDAADELGGIRRG